MRVEFVVVEGAEAVAWRSRQAAAIRALLEWVADKHSDGDGIPEAIREGVDVETEGQAT